MSTEGQVLGFTAAASGAGMATLAATGNNLVVATLVGILVLLGLTFVAKYTQN